MGKKMGMGKKWVGKTIYPISHRWWWTHWLKYCTRVEDARLDGHHHHREAAVIVRIRKGVLVLIRQAWTTAN
jgi:hypothetical protein